MVSVWSGRGRDWAVLLACGASGGVIIWDSNKFECVEKVLGSYFVLVKLESVGEGSFWLTSVYGPIMPLWRKDFLMELQDFYGLALLIKKKKKKIYGLAYPKWCVYRRGF